MFHLFSHIIVFLAFIEKNSDIRMLQKQENRLLQLKNS